MKNDGGPAFPYRHRTGDMVATRGMTLRDWFAGQALSGQLANPTFTSDTIALAQWAYKYADALLAERMKETPDEVTRP